MVNAIGSAQTPKATYVSNAQRFSYDTAQGTLIVYSSITPTGIMAQFWRQDGTFNPRYYIQGTSSGIIHYHTYSSSAQDVIFQYAGTNEAFRVDALNAKLKSSINFLAPIGSTTTGGIEVNSSGGVSIYSNEVNAGALGGTDYLILGNRRTSGIKSPVVYSSTVGVTNRDVYVDDTGLLGYVASLRSHKTNIAPLIDINWLLDLEPVTFNRFETKNNETTVSTVLEYGLIAEEVEQVNKEICYYDKNEDGTDKLAGVNYSRLITPMLKLIQDQQKQIEDLKKRLEAAGL
jgi:hypothetical protein